MTDLMSIIFVAYAIIALGALYYIAIIVSGMEP